MAHRVFFEADARRRLLGGAEIIYKAVAATYGIKGRNVAIGKRFAAPAITHDGVSVANAIDLPVVDDDTLGFRDGAENIKEASRQMNKYSGDATSTVVVLDYKLQEELNRLITGGYDPIELYNELEEAGRDVVQLLENMSEVIDQKSPLLKAVATISAGDATIGRMVADIYRQVGVNGTVSVERHDDYETTYKVHEGFTFDKGFLSELVITDPGKQEGVYTDIKVIVTSDKIEEWSEVADHLAAAMNDKRQVAIIADDFAPEILKAFFLNKRDKDITIIAIKAPDYNERKFHALEDLATVTGAKMITEGSDTVQYGHVDELTITKENTTFVGGGGKKKDIKARVADILDQAANTSDTFIADYLTKRAAALNGKVARIKVGGATEGEIGKKKDHIDDAVASAKRALETGILPGGGVTLLNISSKLKGGNAGRDALIKVLREPFLQLMKNAGLNGEKMIGQVEESEDGAGINLRGVDKNNVKIVDMKEAGVVDATSIVQQAIRVAVSSAGNIATTEVLIVELPDDEAIVQ